MRVHFLAGNGIDTLVAHTVGYHRNFLITHRYGEDTGRNVLSHIDCNPFNRSYAHIEAYAVKAQTATGSSTAQFVRQMDNTVVIGSCDIPAGTFMGINLGTRYGIHTLVIDTVVDNRVFLVAYINFEYTDTLVARQILRRPGYRSNTQIEYHVVQRCTGSGSHTA